MKRPYRGSCDCGAVRYEADLDLADEASRCNCTWCIETRMWKAFALAGDFRLTQGADMLSDYRAADSRWPARHTHQCSCSRCGVRGFSKGRLDVAPFNGEFHAINLATLDDATPEELATARVAFQDGRNDASDRAPAETRHL